jgi:hypothetical protein
MTHLGYGPYEVKGFIGFVETGQFEVLVVGLYMYWQYCNLE